MRVSSGSREDRAGLLLELPNLLLLFDGEAVPRGIPISSLRVFPVVRVSEG